MKTWKADRLTRERAIKLSKKKGTWTELLKQQKKC